MKKCARRISESELQLPVCLFFFLSLLFCTGRTATAFKCLVKLVNSEVDALVLFWDRNFLLHSFRGAAAAAGLYCSVLLRLLVYNTIPSDFTQDRHVLYSYWRLYVHTQSHAAHRILLHTSTGPCKPASSQLYIYQHLIFFLPPATDQEK